MSKTLVLTDEQAQELKDALVDVTTTYDSKTIAAFDGNEEDFNEHKAYTKRIKDIAEQL
jgi:hypothetical protein